MFTRIKKLLKKILPPPTSTFLAAIDKLSRKLLRKDDQILSAVKKLPKQLDKSMARQQNQLNQISSALTKQQEQLSTMLAKQQEQLSTMLAKQQEMLEMLSEENRQLSEKLQHTQRQVLMSDAMLLTYVSGKAPVQPDSWVAMQERFPDNDHPLAFLKAFYRLHDGLIAANTMDAMQKEYVNMALEACLNHLHSEENPTVRQLIYDALKNEVFDALELAGHDPSVYTNEAAYREMQTIIARPYDYNYFSVLSKPFYEQALEKWYQEKTHDTLDLQNPVTYNDKLNWIKLNECDERKTQYSDKYAVREYVASTIGPQYLIPLINVWDDPDEIDFDQLPEQYVLKATHGSGWNLIVPDKSALDIPEAVKRMKWWMGRKLSFCNGLELHYDGIKPRILAEQYMENGNGELNDYKVWCFGGKAYYIQYLAERHHGLKMAFYDLDWNKLPFTYDYPQIPWDVEKPDNLKELIELAEKLAAGFNHVRVDFYRLNSGEWKFGEMTFTSCGGRCKWNPPEYDRIVGELFDLNHQTN